MKLTIKLYTAMSIAVVYVAMSIYLLGCKDLKINVEQCNYTCQERGGITSEVNYIQGQASSCSCHFPIERQSND